MDHLVSALTALEPVHLFYVLAASFLWHAGKSAARGNTKIWSVAGKGIAVAYHDLTVFPAKYFPETPEYYQKQIRHNRIQWICMKAASYLFALLFWCSVIFAALALVRGSSSSGFPGAEAFGMLVSTFLVRTCRVECARLELQRKDFEMKLTEAITTNDGR